MLANREPLVCRDVSQSGAAAVGPLNRHGFERVELAHAERERVIHARLKASGGLELLHELGISGAQGDSRPDRERIRRLAGETDLQEALLGRLGTGVVAVHECLVVHVVHDEVECAVAVQVPVRCAVREARLVEAPGRGDLGERQVAGIAKRVIGEPGRAHRVDQAQEVDALAPCGAEHGAIAGEEGHVVL